jgi:hypothetical protein
MSVEKERKENVNFMYFIDSILLKTAVALSIMIYG